MQRLRPKRASMAAGTSQTEQLLAPAPQQPSGLIKVPHNSIVLVLHKG